MPGIAIECGKISAELLPRPINPAWILDGDPVAHATELWRSFDRMSCTMVWDCTPGRFEWHYDTDETIHILDGAVLLDDGVAPPRRLGPGDVVFFPAGAVVRWTVESRVRKLAFFRNPLPAPIAILTRAVRRILRMILGRPVAAEGGPMAAAPAPLQAMRIEAQSR